MYQKLNRIIISLLVILFFNNNLLAEITFQDILENPSDLEMNLKYASEQESLGRYKSTLSTLERLNMLYPVNTDIKLYLLSILLKMDSAAKLELMIETMLQDPNTTKETRDYIEKILKTIRDQSKPEPKWFAYADVHYMQTDNSNIDGLTKSGFNFFGDSGDQGGNISSGMRYDKTYSRGTTITVGKNLDETSVISFSGGLSVNTQNKKRTFENDLVSSSVSYSKVLGKHFFIPYAFYSRSDERSTASYDTKGIGFNNTYNIDKNNSINYTSSFSSTRYNELEYNTQLAPTDANNDTYYASVGNNIIFFEKNLISSKISYTEKKAKENFNSYHGTGLNIGYTRILPFGTLRLDKTFQMNNYEGKDQAIHKLIDRRDEIDISSIQLSGRLTQLIPFTDKLDPKGQIFYNLNFIESDADSTLLNNSAIRQNMSFRITKRFSLYE
ncbi:hypothetical protein N8700_00470 [Candidatus Pelagibacter sp.]|nr:hypothetical protein [Candidatus Pelagibacter sp.]